MRPCPVCLCEERIELWSMTYKIPDGWPLPGEIIWYSCEDCGMLYGDGDFDQAMLNDYYQHYYGYGVNSPDNKARLLDDAMIIYHAMPGRDALVVDFGGGGDDGRSILVEQLGKLGCTNAHNIGPLEKMPYNCDVIYASHVLEHIYDLPRIMLLLTIALSADGTLIVDVPDSTGLLLRWPMPMLDFNTKHINHFTLRNLLDLGHEQGLEAVQVKPYVLDGAPCVQVHFKKLNLGDACAGVIHNRTYSKAARLRSLFGTSVNVWGLGDITWHMLSKAELNVLDYIDNDPAFRGQTYNGKPILELPTNDEPIVVLAQGQRQRLIEHIRSVCKNEIIEI